PRTRYYFQGYLTKPLEYELSFQRSFSAGMDFFNAYLNYHPDDRFQLRIGRFKAPYTYEFYHLNVWRLIAPERSLFNSNFGLNRMLGGMAWGELFKGRMEYAVGVFDGPRNSFQDYNTAKDVVAYLNFKPFEHSGTKLENLNVGGSVDYGYQNNPLVPAVLRTSANAAPSGVNSGTPISSASVPFLAFNNNVTERGLRALWDLHLAYYQGGLSLLASWSSGRDSY